MQGLGGAALHYPSSVTSPHTPFLPSFALPCPPPARPQSYLPVGASYFSSERSFAQLRLPDAHRALVGFGRDPTTLLVVSSTGGFYKASFDPEKGGNCEQQSFVQWMEEGR